MVVVVVVVVECYCFLINIIVVCVGARRRGPARTDCVFNSKFFNSHAFWLDCRILVGCCCAFFLRACRRNHFPCVSRLGAVLAFFGPGALAYARRSLLEAGSSKIVLEAAFA